MRVARPRSDGPAADGPAADEPTDRAGTPGVGEAAPALRAHGASTQAAVTPSAGPLTPWGEGAGRRDVWPSVAQELLLRAALMPDERALAAWRSVRSQINVDELDGATQALLPALRKNLLELGVEDELLNLFKGVHRYGWARTQLLLAPMMPIVRALEDSGISTLLLKGAAFVADKRLDAGMRPMNDVDVLVPTGQVRAAIAVLLEMGLEPVGEVPAWYVADYAPRFVPSHGFRDELDRQLDLHWHVLHASCQPDADEDFWAAAEPIELLGVPTRALCPADELLLVILHGLRWNAIPTYRWVVDAALLCSGAIGPIDYERLVAQARKRRVSVTVRAGLEYLRRVADAPIATQAIRALGGLHPRVLERGEFRAQCTRPQSRTALQWQLIYHGAYVRRELPLGSRATALTHLHLARRRMGIERLRELGQVFSGGPPGPSRPPSEVAAALGSGTGEPSARRVELGERLELGDAELARSYTAYGTWRAEKEGFWLAGKEALLQLPLAEPARGSLVLDLSADAFTAPGCPSQRLRVSVNGAGATELTIDHRGLEDEPVILPGAAVAGHDRLDLSLGIPDATSLARLGLDEDDRRLGVFLRRARVRAPSAYVVGSALMLGEGYDDAGLLFGGWGEPEQRGRWTVGPIARLLMSLQEPRPALDLEFEAAAFLGRLERRQQVEVSVNGRLLGTLTYEGVDRDPLEPLMTRLALTDALIGAGGDVVIEWRIAEPRSPLSLGLAPDPRELGLFVVKVALVEHDGTRTAA
jgi:Uncharacterised nucleotidyltransferase